MTEKKLPTRSAATQSLIAGSDLGWLSDVMAEQVIEVLEDAGVQFAPEPVAPKRGDVLTKDTELVDAMLIRPAGAPKSPRMWDAYDGWWKSPTGDKGSHEQVLQSHLEYRVVDVPGVVDTPEPAPKYTTWRSGKWIYARRQGNFTASELLADREFLESGIAARQAALDLLDREEQEAGK